MDEPVCVRLTPPGMGAIGVVLLAGPDLRRTEDWFRPRRTGTPLFEDGRVVLGLLCEPDTGRPLDECLWTYSRRHPRFGCDAVELHLHGGPALCERVLSALQGGGFRRLSPSEFLRVLHERGVIRTVTREAESLAPDALCGSALEVLGAVWSGAFDSVVRDAADALAAGRAGPAGALLKTADFGVAAVAPRRFFILGPPNSGKSTLFNALLGRRRAIVSSAAGTTVDVIEARVAVGAVDVVVADAAGVAGETSGLPGRLEKAALEHARKADFVLVLMDGSRPRGEFETRVCEWLAGARARAPIPVERTRVLPIMGKADLERVREGIPGALRVSGLTGAGVKALKGEMERLATRGVGRRVPALFTERQRARARAALEAASDGRRELAARRLAMIAEERTW